MMVRRWLLFKIARSGHAKNGDDRDDGGADGDFHRRIAAQLAQRIRRGGHIHVLDVLDVSRKKFPYKRRSSRIARCRCRFGSYRQTLTHTQIFLKFSQWHCCSMRQFLPLVFCANADVES
jgi:hypothetical protein